jgi:hypothetical protein
LLLNRDSKGDGLPVPTRLRWLAVVSACIVSIFAALAYGGLSLIMGVFLLLGTTIQPRARTSGRWLMWIGGLLLILMVAPFATAIVYEHASIQRQARDGAMIAIFALGALSTILVLWCDIALLLEVLKTRGRRWERGSLDWIVWVAAAELTTWCVWMFKERRMPTRITAA